MPRRWATNAEPQMSAVSSINRSARRAWFCIIELVRQSARLCRKARRLTTLGSLGMLGAASRPTTKTGMSMAAYEILIADDHPLFRSALQQALSLGLGPDVRLVEAASIAELEACLAEKADWDLVLLDLNMPGAYGFSGLVLLRGQYPQIPVVMVSAQEDPAVIVRAREFGASGFIPKSSPLESIQQGVRAVLDGDVWWPAQTLAAVALSAEAKAASAGLASLTPQQFRVLTMVCDGLLNKQIAY